MRPRPQQQQNLQKTQIATLNFQNALGVIVAPGVGFEPTTKWRCHPQNPLFLVNHQQPCSNATGREGAEKALGEKVIASLVPRDCHFLYSPIVSARSLSKPSKRAACSFLLQENGIQSAALPVM
jgi:hypothetical protein